MTRRRQQMLEMIRRHPTDIVLEHSLRKNLIKEGFVQEFAPGVSCMQPGCSLCVVAACPTCGRVGQKGEVVFLVDHEPFVLLCDQNVKPHAISQTRDTGF